MTTVIQKWKGVCANPAGSLWWKAGRVLGAPFAEVTFVGF